MINLKLLNGSLLMFIPLISAVASTQPDCSQPFFSKGVRGDKSLNNKDWGYQYVTDVVLSGSKSQRFELRPGDCGENEGWSDCKNDRERSEITVTSVKMYPGDRRFIAWNIYLPIDFVASPYVNTTLGQIHQRGGPAGTASGLPSFPPLLQFEAKGNTYKVCWHKLSGDPKNVKDICEYQNLSNLSDMLGKWTEIVLDLNLSMETGYAKVYVDGVEKAFFNEPLMRFKPNELYMKYGIYRSFVSRHGGPMPTHIVYYDEVRISNKIEHVSRFVCDLTPLD